ncbi:hypothetical protein [Xanthomonas cucurbitae]|uniref:Uncharacterized protein n=1 Tax=Xanthomonas cucurbitae TaxID=56453 RepID=A0ABY7YA34_9XANT|nr:hypothetical protein [Xanthomonas cucurbitae]WDM66853.1 hypothetical protein K6981_15290 [Xanthomonas cucurbitae]WDM70730.1 hypothetical protein K6978_15260 [Xanthomonas cucurbitae]
MEGLEIRDPNTGEVVVRYTSRLSRMAEFITIPAGSTGSVHVDVRYGQPWAYPQPVAYGGYAPFITVESNGTISWQPNNSYPGGAADVRLSYGVR